MGSWDYSIMGGDTPLDIKYDFDHYFLEQVPSSEAAISLMNDITATGTDSSLVKVVMGFLIIERSGQMSDELRSLILQGIDEEEEAADNWSNPEKRLAVLSEFRKLVVDYPTAGAKITMPYQPGLFETIEAGMNTK